MPITSKINEVDYLAVIADDTTDAVSYTHLDVYKRQAYNSLMLLHK